MKRWTLWGALALATALVAGNAQAMLIAKTNLVDLVRDADSVVLGTVTSVSDGIEPNYGLPYTEVTLSVEETLRGDPSDTFTFRQIGLLQPRLTADGTKMMPGAPADMPHYPVGARVLLFMGPTASMTGLQSPIGLGYGKFTLGPGTAENDYTNTGVFLNVSLGAGLATANDARILTTATGAVNPDDLLSLVRRAVSGNWPITCKMWKTDEGAPTCVPSSKRPVPPPVNPPKPIDSTTPVSQPGTKGVQQ